MALTIEWASFFTLQLHTNDCCFGDKMLRLWEDNNRTNVPQTAITYLDCISIKYLVDGMIPWKIFRK